LNLLAASPASNENDNIPFSSSRAHLTRTQPTRIPFTCGQLV